MIHIPTSYIVSSRFSTLEPNDILKILHLAEQTWDEKEIKKRLRIPEKPFIGIGITNPQELDTVMKKQNIPIIHIHSECKSLQANQKHKLEKQYYWHRCLWFSESTLWGIIGYRTIVSLLSESRTTADGSSLIATVLNRRSISSNNNNLFNLQNWVTRTALVTICLFTTKKLLYHQIQKREYHYVANNSTFILLRNDIVISKFKYIYSNLIPSILMSTTVYMLLTKCCGNKAALY